MYVFRRAIDLQNHLTAERVNKRTLGFVPTMGALHQGHLSLINQSLEENQITVCSIFVNPTQFNESNDLEKYPRSPEIDLKKLSSVGCQVVFLPTFDEVYPNGSKNTHTWNFGGLDTIMEGAKRPGHFEGMAQVVKRFLDIVQPDFLYMGQKDFQQQLIVKRMIDELKMGVVLKIIATKREEDGLAMSSRNTLLTKEIRNEANLIYNTLLGAKTRLLNEKQPRDIELWAINQLTQTNFTPEYFSIVNGETLKIVTNIDSVNLIVACTAVQAGKVRLIDNMVLKGQL